MLVEPAAHGEGPYKLDKDLTGRPTAVEPSVHTYDHAECESMAPPPCDAHNHQLSPRTLGAFPSVSSLLNLKLGASVEVDGRLSARHSSNAHIPRRLATWSLVWLVQSKGPGK